MEAKPNDPNQNEFLAIANEANPDLRAVAEIVRKHMQPVVLHLKQGALEGDVLLLPGEKGETLYEDVRGLLEPYRTCPERREGTANMTDLDSFNAHVNRFKDADTVVFAKDDRTAPALEAVLDYHRAGPEAAPRFGRHRTRYSFPLSEAWKAWRAQSGKWMDQATFAAFIEDRLADVADPDGAGDAADAAKDFIARFGSTFASPGKLLDLSKGLSLRVGMSMKNAVNLDTGEVQMQFITENTDGSGAPLKVPSAILLMLPVFERGAPFLLPCRLRHRAVEQRVMWSLTVYRDDLTFDAAFAGACKKTAEATGVPVYRGAPESK